MFWSVPLQLTNKIPPNIAKKAISKENIARKIYKLYDLKRVQHLQITERSRKDLFCPHEDWFEATCLVEKTTIQ